MGGNKRRHKKRKEVAVPSTSSTEGETNHDGGDDHQIVVHLECAKDNNNNNYVNPLPPPVWSTEFVENIEKKLPSNVLPSVTDVGLQLVRGTLEKISSRRYKKVKKNKKNNKGSNQSSSLNIDTTKSVKPTPIQLRMWPALLHSFESYDTMNVVGIAPTGTVCLHIISHSDI